MTRVAARKTLPRLMNTQLPRMLLALLVINSSIAYADLFKCRKADGSIEYSDSGCNGKTVEQRYKYTRPTDQQTGRPSTQTYRGNRDLDSSARQLGFQSYNHFERARQICLELLQRNPLISSGTNCGTNLQCLQREAEAMQRRYENLTRSSSWVTNKCNIVVQVESGSRSTGSGDSYQVEVSHNDELFIINGEKYEAKTYCFNIYEGDEVIFIDGSPFGACASATILNLRTKDKCELWCE
jgi:hypothetical protein